MKNYFVWLLVLGGMVLSSCAFAGEATVKEKLEFNTSFEKFTAIIKDQQNGLWSQSMGRVEILEEKDDRIKMKVSLPRKEGVFTLKVSEHIDHKKQTAQFSTKLIETDGIIRDQKTDIMIYEVNGKVCVEITLYADVPDVSDRLIKLDLRRSINKVTKQVNEMVGVEDSIWKPRL